MKYFSFFSRFGEGEGDAKEVSKSGTVDGGQGVYSSSSVSVGPDGKGTYSVQAGKIP